MNEISDINQISWELAALSILKIGNNVGAYSTSQIRKIISASNSGISSAELNNIIYSYIPAPPRSESPAHTEDVLKSKREKNRDFGDTLLNVLQNNSEKDSKRIMKYTLWNIMIIGDMLPKIEKISFILDCEGIKDKDKIVDALNKIVNGIDS